MTQKIEKYRVSPVTVLELTDLVLAKKWTEGNNEDVVYYWQVGYGKDKKPTKPLLGHFKELGYVPYKVVKIKVTKDLYDAYKVGDKLAKNISELLKDITKVDVTGTSKGKGFAGVVKRWNFAGGPKTHGQKHDLRGTGSIGAQTPGRVLKGKKMPGHMGVDKVTVKNLKIEDIYLEDDKAYLLVKGAVPGAYGSLVVIKF